MVMHDALALTTPRHQRVDAASFADASFTMATSAAGYDTSSSLPVNSTSVSENSKIGGGGGGGVTVGH